MSATTPSTTVKRRTPPGPVTLFCECGQSGAKLRHYDVCRCSCGRWHWALQPEKDGPLVIQPWPGFNFIEPIRENVFELAEA